MPLTGAIRDGKSPLDHGPGVLAWNRRRIRVSRGRHGHGRRAATVDQVGQVHGTHRRVAATHQLDLERLVGSHGTGMDGLDIKRLGSSRFRVCLARRRPSEDLSVAAAAAGLHPGHQPEGLIPLEGWDLDLADELSVGRIETHL